MHNYGRCGHSISNAGLSLSMATMARDKTRQSYKPIYEGLGGGQSTDEGRGGWNGIDGSCLADETRADESKGRWGDGGLICTVLHANFFLTWGKIEGTAIFQEWL